MVYGYARVSSKEQNLDRQIIDLKKAGVVERYIYFDKASGKNFNRRVGIHLLELWTLHLFFVKVTCLLYPLLSGWGETIRRYKSNGSTSHMN